VIPAASQFQFATELVGMLVAASGLVLVTLRSDITRRGSARLAVGLGFAVLGAVAFDRGSQLAPSDRPGLLAAGRAVGVALVVLGALGWAGARRSRVVLLAGAALTAAGAAAEASRASSVLISVLLVAGSVMIGLALLGAARRSIAIRVAANAAATLLLVVLVLSVALSSVITSSVQHQQLIQFRTRVAVEAGALAAAAADALEGSRLVAADLDGLAASDPLTVLRGTSGRTALAARVRMIASFYPVGTIGYLPADGRPLGSSSSTAAVGRLPVAGDLGCARGAPGVDGRRDLVVVDGRALAVGAFAVCAEGMAAPLGTVVVATPLDAGFLAGIRRADPGLSLALVAAGVVVARVGDRPPASELQAPNELGPQTGASARLDGGRFVAVVPVAGLGADRATVLTLVASLPMTSIAATRDSLLRTLFIIALGGTVLALGLAAVTGDRITSGLRRLTTVAKGIQEGRSSQRVGSLSHDEVGSLAGAFDAMVDSVEEKNAALSEAADGETRLRNRLEAVVAGMSDALVAVDSTGTVTDFNRAAEELTGLDAADAIGRHVAAVVVLSGLDADELARQVAPADDATWADLSRIVRADGEVPVAISSGPVRGPADEVVGRVLVLRDLRREQELERMKSEFLSRVGHELRTPLTSILGYADILVRREVPGEQAKGWYGEILSAAKRQLRIVQLLEFFASSGGGRLLIRPRPTEVRALVDGAVSSWADRLPESVRLTVRVPPDLPEVLGDARWLTLALDELIDNAVKFSPDGGRVLVRATLADGESAGPGVEISVSDRGQGMTREEQDRAFADFQQGDASDTRRFGGLGLGLSAVARVVAGHGGRVECRSALGRGTTMTVWLPLATIPVVDGDPRVSGRRLGAS
jgi:two-component system phosphate regulon sensor histidine kinase PhoR